MRLSVPHAWLCQRLLAHCTTFRTLPMAEAHCIIISNHHQLAGIDAANVRTLSERYWPGSQYSARPKSIARMPLLSSSDRNRKLSGFTSRMMTLRLWHCATVRRISRTSLAASADPGTSPDHVSVSVLTSIVSPSLLQQSVIQRLCNSVEMRVTNRRDQRASAST